jgi:hypothetical protein
LEVPQPRTELEVRHAWAHEAIAEIADQAILAGAAADGVNAVEGRQAMVEERLVERNQEFALLAIIILRKAINHPVAENCLAAKHVMGAVLLVGRVVKESHTDRALHELDALFEAFSERTVRGMVDPCDLEFGGVKDGCELLRILHGLLIMTCLISLVLSDVFFR